MGLFVKKFPFESKTLCLESWFSRDPFLSTSTKSWNSISPNGKFFQLFKSLFIKKISPKYKCAKLFIPTLVNRGNDTLLTYLYNQFKSSISLSNTILNKTMIGFIDSIEVHSLNQSNPFLYRLNRFDPSIFLVISFVIICMLIGNEWHRRIFLNKIREHYSSTKTNKFHIGLIIGLLLFSFFTILYLLDRYLTFIIEEIYRCSFIILSSLVIYLCFYELYQRFRKNKNDELDQWFRIIFMLISFSIVIFWFLNRFTFIGLIQMNIIVFCMTIVIISQMRIVNLMICMIIFGFIFLFECLSLIIINLQFPENIWMRIVKDGF